MFEEKGISPRSAEITQDDFGVVVLEDPKEADQLFIIPARNLDQLHQSLNSERLDMFSPRDNREKMTQRLS